MFMVGFLFYFPFFARRNRKNRKNGIGQHTEVKKLHKQHISKNVFNTAMFTKKNVTLTTQGKQSYVILNRYLLQWIQIKITQLQISF